MNIRTKVITTIIAMVCSLSVSATGIVAVMMSFETQVANSTSLEIGNIQGDLYGARIGADNQDLDMWALFKKGEGVLESELAYFCRDVNFSLNSKKIEYVLKFALAEDADSMVLVGMEQSGLTDTNRFTAAYKVAFGQSEPDWSTAQDITVGDKHIVDDTNPYIWLYASLEINQNTTTRITSSGDATWVFSFSFTGIAVSD